MVAMPTSVDRVQDRLEFNNKYREALIGRTSDGTIRAGKRIPPESLALPVTISGSGESLGTVRVDEVRWLHLREIANPQILRHVYPFEAGALILDLKSIYPALTDESWVTFFRFHFDDAIAKDRALDSGP